MTNPPKSWNNLIYLIIDDDQLNHKLTESLRLNNYQCVRVSYDNVLISITKNMPAALLTDTEVPTDQKSQLAHPLNRIHKRYPRLPIIFISNNNNIHSRLAASRVGALRYLSKTVAHQAIVKILNGLTGYNQENPFRVLVIDDDKALGPYYCALLHDAGIIAEHILNPLETLEKLPSFNPDLLLIDLYMPECSGIELARVIRQNDQYAQLPIVFLSAENDSLKQLEALNVGAEAFFTKPINAKPLIETLLVKLKRARHLTRLNNDLVTALDEATSMQKEMEGAKQEAEKANQAKNRFISSMSHELRTPMNAILGFSQLLSMDDLTEDQMSSVDEIINGGDHLLSLIDDILNLSQIESGNVNLSIESVNIQRIIQECLSLIQPIAEKYQVTLKNNTNDNNNNIHTTVLADQTRIKQVILNLLSNACKYNKEDGEVIIHYSNTKNNRLKLTIQDTGQGISAENQLELFKPFNRLGLENSNIQGTGIGLTITKQLIELMNGTLGLESIIDQGSQFWIELPLDEAPIAIEAIATPIKIPQNNKVSHAAQFKVLYIEDNPANLRLVMNIRLPI